MCRAVRSRGSVEPVFVPRIDEIATALREVLRDGDVILMMGAGHIGAIARELPQKLSAVASAAVTERRRGERP